METDVIIKNDMSILDARLAGKLRFSIFIKIF